MDMKGLKLVEGKPLEEITSFLIDKGIEYFLWAYGQSRDPNNLYIRDSSIDAAKIGIDSFFEEFGEGRISRHNRFYYARYEVNLLDFDFKSLTGNFRIENGDLFERISVRFKDPANFHSVNVS